MAFPTTTSLNTTNMMDIDGCEEENIVWGKTNSMYPNNDEHSKLIREIQAVVDAGEKKVGAGSQIRSFTHKINETKQSLSAQKAKKRSPGTQNQLQSKPPQLNNHAAPLTEGNKSSSIMHLKEHVAAVDVLVLKLKEISLQKEMGGVEVVKACLRSELQVKAPVTPSNLPTAIYHFSSFWITLAYLEKSPSKIESVVMEGIKYIVGDIERSILHAELEAVRFDLENSGFVQEVDEILSDSNSKATTAESVVLNQSEEGNNSFDSSSPNREDGIAEEFGNSEVALDLDEQPTMFDKRTERSLFATSSDVLAECLATQPNLHFNEFVASTCEHKETLSDLSNEAGGAAPPRDRRLSYTRIGDVLNGCLSQSKSNILKENTTSTMGPPPSRLVTSAKAVIKSTTDNSSSIRDSESICLKRMQQANEEVAKFNQKKARKSTNSNSDSDSKSSSHLTPRRSQRKLMKTSRDTPRYKK